jgi:two-component system chemotaxis sensor kinase CheA
MNRGSLAARLLAAFLEDLEEQLRAMDADLLALEAHPADGERLRSLFRVAHTVKGAARAAAVPLVEEACHALEARLAEVRDGARALDAGAFRALFSAADALREAGSRLAAGEPLEGSAVERLAALLRDHGLAMPEDAPAAAAAPEPAAPAERGDGRVRVEEEKLDALLASAVQLVASRGRISARVAEAAALRDACARAESRHRRATRAVRAALERAGVPASAADGLAAADEELRNAAREAARLAAEAAAEARELGQVTDELTDRVRRLRLRPFADACEALPRVARDVAAASGKEVKLVVRGGDVQADRGVIEGLREALLHLVRNAVDHGIEAPGEREARGKPRAGTLVVSAALHRERMTVTVEDDGRGIDTGAVRAALQRRGMPVPTDERELARALFASGLSTRTEATRISGRGVGLDAVRAAAERVRGTLDVTWTTGAGATFVLETPLVLATLRALLVRVGDHLLALPTSAVDALVRIRPESVHRADGRDVAVLDDVPVQVASLARILGPPLREARPAGAPLVAALLRAGGRRLAAVVDEPVAELEIAVRPLERPEGPLPHLVGAAILGTGEVALVLSPGSLVEAAGALAGGEPLAGTGADAAPPARHRVLVVDDSITTRTLEQSTLEAAGYEVVVAVDGVDAWTRLQGGGIEVVVTDVEMPRMGGIELCETIRASQRFAALPVVLVTSLDSAEHRARGLEAGADAYVGKSSFDQQGLLEIIRQLVG